MTEDEEFAAALAARVRAVAIVQCHCGLKSPAKPLPMWGPVNHTVLPPDRLWDQLNTQEEN